MFDRLFYPFIYLVRQQSQKDQTQRCESSDEAVSLHQLTVSACGDEPCGWQANHRSHWQILPLSRQESDRPALDNRRGLVQIQPRIASSSLQAMSHASGGIGSPSAAVSGCTVTLCTPRSSLHVRRAAPSLCLVLRSVVCCALRCAQNGAQ